MDIKTLASFLDVFNYPIELLTLNPIEKIEFLKEIIRLGHLEKTNRCIHLWYTDDYKLFIGNYFLYDTCLRGHLNLTELMLSLGATSYDNGLVGACENGHLSLINLMISLGANDYDFGIEASCMTGQLSSAKLMISLGVKNYDNALYYARLFKHEPLVKLLLDKI